MKTEFRSQNLESRNPREQAASCKGRHGPGIRFPSRQGGRKNEAKTKPKCGVARGFGGGLKSTQFLYLQGSAKFFGRSQGANLERGKLQNEATDKVMSDE